jgi:uncharacterized membrane protein YjjB (DUF3815 family)
MSNQYPDRLEFDRSSQEQDWEDRCSLLLSAARSLHENGQETGETIAAISHLGGALGIKASLFPAWGELFVQIDSNHGSVLSAIAATPSNVSMNRVTATLRTIEAICEGRIVGADAKEALAAASRRPPSELYLFVLACVAGAVALALIFGASHLQALALIAFSAAIGALLRRGMARFGIGSFLQVFSAASIAGFVGALAVRWQISSALRLVAVCPCMVMIPGPHILNGALDLAALRMPLGSSRLGFATLTVFSICAGLLIGLTLGGSDLPAFEPARQVPLWLDTLAAGVAAASYGIFFSMPLRMLVWPVLAGMVAHAARWEAMSLGMNAILGTGIACAIVGVFLVPISQRLRLPFAAIGFASVVSLVPGIFLFRMSSGLVQIQQDAASTKDFLLAAVFSDGITALLIISAMLLGLVVPMHIFSHLKRKKAIE